VLSGPDRAAPRSVSRPAQLKAGVLVLALCATVALLLPARSLAETPEPEWSLQSLTQSPQPRDHAEMAYDAATGKVVLTGGEGGGSGETWTYDGATWAAQSTAQSPPQLYASGVAYDAADEQIVIADGIVNGGMQSVTWTYDGATWIEQHPAQSTPELYVPAMAYDPATEQVVLFGGQEELGDSNETWTWNGSTWTRQSTPQSPPGRIAASMAYDAASKQLILFGGIVNQGDSNETWAYNGTTWTKLSPVQSPPGGLEGSMAYDAATGQIVYFGGPGNGGNETWTFDGTEWTRQTTPAGLYPRYGTSMAYDPATRAIVLFGGAGEAEEEEFEVDNETWLYGPAPKATPTLSQSASEGVALGGKVSDDATLAGGESPTGKLDFELFGPADGQCGAAPVFTSEVTVSAAGSYESAAYEPAEAGTYHWLVSYAGDVGNEAAASSCGEANGSVTVASPGVTEPPATTTTTTTEQPSPTAATSAVQPPPTTTTVSRRGSARLTIYTKAPKGLINSHRLDLVVGCGEAPCALSATARVIVPGLDTTVMLHGATSLGANQVHAIAFAVPRRERALLRGYLRRHRDERMELDVAVTMTAAGTTRQTASTLLGVWTLPGLR
jgi:hypothetical protein